MKVLVVLSRFPWPLDKGDKLRSYHQIRTLSERNEIHLVAISDVDVPDEHRLHLEAYCKSIEIIRIRKITILARLLKNIFFRTPYQVAYFYSHQIEDRITDLRLDINPDVVFFQLIRTAEFAWEQPYGQVLDYMDALSAGMEKRIPFAPSWLRFLWRSENKRLAQFETDVFGRFGGHLIISGNDLEVLSAPDKKRITILPNGVDTTRFMKCRGYKPTGHVLFHGNLSYPPNEQAAIILSKEIMQEVWKAKPDKKLILSGAQPSPSVRKLKSSRIEVTGWCDDVTENFSGASVFAAPLRMGTGLQNKLLEAMAAGIPCVTSPQAASALGAVHGVHLLVAENNNAFTEGILKLSEDTELAEKLITNSRKLLQKFTWSDHSKVLEGVLKQSQIA